MARKPRKYLRPADYLRAAHQRLDAAKYLLQSQGFRLEAVYLAGYAVECALKAVIVKRTPPSQRDGVREEFRGGRAHDLEHLKWRLAELNCPMPKAIVEAMRRFIAWSPDLRYAAGFRAYNETRPLLDAADVVVDWMERNM